MARKDLPYLPLYVQDFLTDEKLMECSASATGVYVRIMCVLHKCIPYGKLLLKQKDKQNEQQINNFANKLAKHLPYDLLTIVGGLNELIVEDVLQIEGDYLLQKRMVNDGILSAKRSESGKKGGFAPHNFATAKTEATTENDIDISNSIHNSLNTQNGKTKKSPVNFRGEGEVLLLKRISDREQKLNASRDKDNQGKVEG